MNHEPPADDIPTLRRILKECRVLAVVGLSAQWHRPSYFAAKYMLEHGYRVIPVNPQYREVLGQKCYASLRDIPEKVDLVDVFRKTADVPPIAEDAIAIGARVLWQQLGVRNEQAAALFGSIQFLGWLGDALFLGANRPFLRAMMVLIEQGLRIGLMIVLLAQFQITALVIAYFVGILVRGVVSYFVAHKFCFPQRFYFWQSLAAPVIAAGLHYLFLSLIAQFVWQKDEISSIILFFIGLLPAMPVFFFFYALAGGWDNAGLDEVTEASQMTDFLRPIIHVVFVVPSRWGAKVSPLHNRFPITMRASALAEAAMLSEQKVKLN